MFDWLRQLFKPTVVSTTKRGGWRCNYCKAEGMSIHDITCGSQDGNACPLAPIDTTGRELSYEEWRDAK